MERFNIPRAGQKPQHIKHKFIDDYGDSLEVYKFGDRVFIDGTFEGGRRPDFRTILTVDHVRNLADKLNDLADEIEYRQIHFNR